MIYFVLPSKKPQTIFQVGAFKGEKKLIDHSAVHDHKLYMFEPNPKRAKVLHDTCRIIRDFCNSKGGFEF